METRIRVLTRPETFEQRKQQCIERGYRIEAEQTVAVNGFRSFVAVRHVPAAETADELLTQALRRQPPR
jgi:hypothetical protein